jgi:hypothetical protein
MHAHTNEQIFSGEIPGSFYADLVEWILDFFPAERPKAENQERGRL